MKANDTQEPHGPGIAETSGKEVSQSRLTPPGVSEVGKEDVLAEASSLKQNDFIAEAMSHNSLSPETRAALTSDKGFQTDVPAEGGYNDGSPVLVSGTDKLATGSGESMTGFLGRFNCGQVR